MKLSSLIIVLFLAVCATADRAVAQLGTAFTYQGLLEVGGTPYTGQADFTFVLFDAATAGANLGGFARANVSVVRGIFTVDVDFGSDVFTAGAPRWVEVASRAPAGVGVYTTLGRQAIKPAPGAKTAAIALGLPGVNVTNGTMEITNGVLRRGAVGSITTTDLGLYSMNTGNWLRFVSSNAPIQFFTNTAQGGSLNTPTLPPSLSIDLNGWTTQTSSATGGTFANMANTSSGGRMWSLVSSGSASTEGAGKLLIRDATSSAVRMVLDANGNVGIGTTAPAEKLHVAGNIRANVVIIDGADLAERYDVLWSDEQPPKAGMVVSIDPDHPGKLRVASRAFDRTVAGIISGADGIRPALVLGQPGTIADGQFPIANVGRVWCYADADAAGAINPGDFLTTSTTAGHAMRADSAHGSGAILGKAMTRLEKGRGMVLVLVSLQ